MGELARKPEPSASGAGDSAFDDFLSRLRPYPAAPDFRVGQLYAAAGSALMLLAAGAAALLPSGEAMRDNGFHAVGAAPLVSVLEAFGTLALPLAGLGAAGLLATAVVAVVNRSTAIASGILVALPVIGVVSVTSVGIGWLLLLIVTVLNLLFWIAAAGLIGAGLLFVLRGQLIIGLTVAVLGFAAISALENAASDQVAGSPGTAASQSADLTPAPVERHWEGQRAQRQAEQRRRKRIGERRALGRRRAALKRRMDVEYAAWQQVPYVAPCESTKRVELDGLRREFSEMARALRAAQRNGQDVTFRQVRIDLDRVTREREWATSDPHGFYDRFGTCPSGPRVMRWAW